MTTVTLVDDIIPGHVRVTFAYDPALVEALKSVVPASYRSWSPSARAWSIALHCVRHLTAYLIQAGHPIVDLRTRGGATTPPRRPAPAPPAVEWAEALLDAVGPDRVEAVHRALTRVLHPDAATGDTQLQQALNVARDRRAVRRAA
ncbi:MAG: hypothetical protein L0I24_00320 [Pseudonocardia sp.]|nr:hypothetical protein [Pseudonocardia sp.]